MTLKSFKSQQPRACWMSVSGEQAPLIKLLSDKQKLQTAVEQQQQLV